MLKSLFKYMFQTFNLSLDTPPPGVHYLFLFKVASFGRRHPISSFHALVGLQSGTWVILVSSVVLMILSYIDHL